MNNLLLWMTAKRAGSQRSFTVRAAESDPGSGRQRAPWHRVAQWNLARLCHAEFGDASIGAGWRIAPPVIAAGSPTGPCAAVLCGARAPGMVQRLSESRTATLQISVQADGPDIAELAAPDRSSLEAAAADAGIPLQWHSSLLLLTASIAPKARVLEPIQRPTGNWSVERFSKSRLRWVESSMDECERSKHGLFRFQSEIRREVALIEGSRAFSCDPSEAKFRILRRRNRALAYDRHTAEFSVVPACRPPLLIERALILCSGSLPAFRDDRLVYGRVPPTVAAAIGALLDQRLD